MDLYKNKYLKYKIKYLSIANSLANKNKYTLLKKSILNNNKDMLQTGGGELYNIYTFNVLNPKPSITQNLFNKLYSQSKIDGTIVKNLSEIDKIRFDKFRKQALLNIISTWLHDINTIVCLQEVNQELCDELKILYGDKIAIAGDKKEYRVTIISTNLSFLKITHIDMLSTMNPHKPLEINKQCLYTLIENNNTRKKLQSFNVHFYWKSTTKHFKKYVNDIKLNILDSVPYFIAGDFNRTLLDPALKYFRSKFINKDVDYNLDIDTGSFTSHDTMSDTNSFAIIDYIIIGNNIEYKFQPKIISRVNNYTIFYDIDKLYKTVDTVISDENIFDKSELKSKLYNELADKWLLARENCDISDHKPVYALIII